MKTVAKLLIKHNEDYLMMYRSNHPTFGTDPDLPGGTAEGDESTLRTMLREVDEEISLVIQSNRVREIYSGSSYSKHGTFYSLFITELSDKPEIVMSWEHSSYEWVGRSEFVDRALAAKDTYMHMVGKTLQSYNFTESA